MVKLRVRIYSNGLCIAQKRSLRERIEMTRGFGWTVNDAINDWYRLNEVYRT